MRFKPALIAPALILSLAQPISAMEAGASFLVKLGNYILD